MSREESVSGLAAELFAWVKVASVSSRSIASVCFVFMYIITIIFQRFAYLATAESYLLKHP